MGRRHLTFHEASSALQRGATVEQFLERRPAPSGHVIRWLSVEPARSGTYQVRCCESLDVGGVDFADVYEFPSVDAEFPDGRTWSFATRAEALAWAAHPLGAVPDRFVNQGVIQDEYLDHRRQP